MDFLRDNPDSLDEPAEIRAAVRDAGGDPMDVGTREQAQFANSLLNAWENEADRPTSREDPAVFAAEAEMVATALEERYGVDVEELPRVRDAPAWYGEG